MSVEHGNFQEQAEFGKKYSRSNEELFAEMIQLRDRSREEDAAKIRERIIEKNRPLAHYITKRFGPTPSLEMGDFESLAFEGLIFAVDHYELDRGAKFSTYAFPCITGYILTHLTQQSQHQPNP